MQKLKKATVMYFILTTNKDSGKMQRSCKNNSLEIFPFIIESSLEIKKIGVHNCFDRRYSDCHHSRFYGCGENNLYKAAA